MTGPLDGVVVVDASWGMPSAIATMLLADYGATVVKVERPGDVDPGQQALRAVLDRGKRSVALDLDTPDGVARLGELLASADVFVESEGPGRAEARGYGYEVVHAAHPELVYLSLSGYGTDTPWSADPGFEALVNARMGMTAEQRGHRDGPIFLGHPTVSYGTAFMSVIGVLSALRARALGAGGQRVDTSLLDGMLTLASMNWWWNERDISYLARSGKQTGFGRSRLITNPFQCADGEWLTPHTGGPGSFKRMMDLLGFGDRIQKVDGPEMSVPLDDDELDVARNLVPEAFRSRPRDEWVQLFAEHDIACLPVLRPEEVLDQPQVQHAGIVAAIDDDALGQTRQIGPVLRFAGTPAGAPTRAPRVGEHDAEPLPAGIARWSFAGEGKPLDRPLEGLRIVDFSSYFATGFASRLLADLGADVIKVEPLQGDQMRPLGDLWEASQRGKRGISVDLRTPEGREIAERLVRGADVVTVNFRPGKAEKVGLGYEQVKVLNPEVLYVYLPGFGSTGPMAELKSFAPLQSGYVGLNFEGAGAGNAPIRVMGNEDQYNGFLGAVAILMGSLSRLVTGRGQYVESPQLHSSLFVRTELAATGTGDPLFGHALDAEQTGFGPLYRLYRTADGWIMIAVFGDDAFARLCRALGVEALARDPRFASAAARHEHRAALTEALEARIGALSTEDASVALAAERVPAEVPADSPFMPELLWEEWATETGRVVEHHHPEYGWCREVGMTVRLSQTPGRFDGPSPRLGEHTRAVLAELGYEQQQIDALMGTVCKEPQASEAAAG